MALLAYSATDPQAADVMRSAYTGAHTFRRAFTEASAIGLYAVISGLQGPCSSARSPRTGMVHRRHRDHRRHTHHPALNASFDTVGN